MTKIKEIYRGSEYVVKIILQFLKLQLEAKQRQKLGRLLLGGNARTFNLILLH
jgi:hypothetical protein